MSPQQCVLCAQEHLKQLAADKLWPREPLRAIVDPSLSRMALWLPLAQLALLVTLWFFIYWNVCIQATRTVKFNQRSAIRKPLRIKCVTRFGLLYWLKWGLWSCKNDWNKFSSQTLHYFMNTEPLLHVSTII